MLCRYEALGEYRKYLFYEESGGISFLMRRVVVFEFDFLQIDEQLEPHRPRIMHIK